MYCSITCKTFPKCKKITKRPCSRKDLRGVGKIYFKEDNKLQGVDEVAILFYETLNPGFIIFTLFILFVFVIEGDYNGNIRKVKKNDLGFYNNNWLYRYRSNY